MRRDPAYLLASHKCVISTGASQLYREAEWRDPCILPEGPLRFRGKMDKPGYVYILSSGFKHLYTGVTSNLDGEPPVEMTHHSDTTL